MDFSSNKNGKLGKESRCKFCIKLYRMEYKQKNPDTVKMYWVKYRNENLDKVKAKDRKNRSKKRLENPDIVKQQKKKSYEKTKSKVLIRNSTYVKNRIKVDPSFRLAINLRSRLNKVINKKQKSGSAVRDLGCSVEFLKTYLESKFQEGMSWENYGNGTGTWQIDHIKPLCSFNLINREELLEACNYNNLQPLWFSEHLIKTIGERYDNIKVG